MAWLRIDDHESMDARVGELTDREYRARHGLLQLCAREHRDDGIFDPREIVYAVYATPRGPRACTRRDLARFRALGMVKSRAEYSAEELHQLGLDWAVDDERLRVHKWERYNPPRDVSQDLDRRVASFLSQHPDASANDVAAAIPGQRAQILAAVRRHRTGGTGTGSGTGTGTGGQGGTGTGSEGGSAGGTQVVSRAGARGRPRPVPSRSTTSTSTAAADDTDANDAAAAVLERIDDLGLNGRARELAAENPDRAQAWLDLAEHEAERNPAAFVLSGLRSGEWPSQRGPLKRRKVGPAPCVECGVGGGQHAAGCSNVVRPTREPVVSGHAEKKRGPS